MNQVFSTTWFIGNVRYWSCWRLGCCRIQQANPQQQQQAKRANEPSAGVERLHRLLKRLSQKGFWDEIRAQDLLGDYPAVRYYPPSGNLFFDIMTRLGKVANYDTVQSEVKEIEGIRVFVATSKSLFEMKKGTLRPLDHQDAAALRERASTSRRTSRMTIERFRSIEQMNEAKIRVRPEIVFDRFIRHCRRFRLIAKPSYPRGVFKFRTIEEAQAARTRQTSIRR